MELHLVVAKFVCLLFCIKSGSALFLKLELFSIPDPKTQFASFKISYVYASLLGLYVNRV